MKNKCFRIGIVILLLFTLSLPTVATYLHFETEKTDITPDDYTAKISLVTWNTEVVDKDIVCFAVSSSGMIALGLDDGSEHRKINIYDSDGNYLYGYAFSINGRFGLEWEEDNIVICTVRGNTRAVFDKFGNCIKVSEIMNTPSNSEYWDKNIFSKRKVYENDNYVIRNPNKLLNFILYYNSSQLVKVDEFGNETIFYDSSR